MKNIYLNSTDNGFGTANIPFGIGSCRGRVFAATRIGDHVIDLSLMAATGAFLTTDGFDPLTLQQPFLNAFIAQGKEITSSVRKTIQEIFTREELPVALQLYPVEEVRMHLPLHIPNYTDFYSSREHATNVGIMFRGKENALMPNWLHLPVGYHGRASSIAISGTPFHRPKGQSKKDEDPAPVFGQSRLLDFELEMAFVIGKGTRMGESVPAEKAEDYIFGLLLFNDWSARDLQKWEYVPLGPFLGKNFFSSVSPWIVTIDALEPFRCAGPEQNPEPLPYLRTSGKHNFDVALEVGIRPENGVETVVCRSNYKYLYWNMCQQLAHHTVNGCNIEVGDLYASGTISGPDEGSYGSMLELSWQGKNPVAMNDGSMRRFIEDGDTVIVRGMASKDGLKISFGELSNKVLPALP